MASTDVIFNIGMMGAAAATADISNLINKFKELKTAVYAGVSASEDYYDVVNRTSMEMTQFATQTKGMIDNLTSVKQANVLAAAGVKVTAQEFANFGKGAIEVAQAVGEDATTMFERLTAAIVRGSSRGLIPFGVHLKETTDKTAAQEEAVKALSAKFADLTVETDDMNERVFAFNNTLDTLKNQLIAPAFGNFIGWIGGVDNGFNELSNAMSTFSADLSAGGQDFATWATSAEGALNIISGVWAEITGNTEDATAAAEEYYLQLQRSKEKERQKREDNARKQEEMRNMGLVGQNEATLQEMEAYISNYEIEQEFGFGKGKRSGGGGGNAKQKRSAMNKKNQDPIDAYRDQNVDLALKYTEQQMQEEMRIKKQAQQDYIDYEMQLADQRLAAYNAENQRLLDAEAMKYEQMNEMQRAQYDRSQAWAKADMMGKMQIGQSALAGTAALLGQAASLQDTQSKKGFEKSKNLQIAQIGINTPAGAVAAYQAMAGIPYIGPFVGAAAAATFVAFSVAQMAKIKKQKFNGGGDSSVSVPASAVGTPAGGLNNYGAGSSSGGGSTIVNNVILDGTVIHSSMIRANDGASQRGERSFSTAA
jgi:hypothetical protein